MNPWEERQENEDQLQELKRERPKIVRVNKWVDWEYFPIKLYNLLFKRRKDNVDKN